MVACGGGLLQLGSYAELVQIGAWRCLKTLLLRYGLFFYPQIGFLCMASYYLSLCFELLDFVYSPWLHMECRLKTLVFVTWSAAHAYMVNSMMYFNSAPLGAHALTSFLKTYRRHMHRLMRARVVLQVCGTALLVDMVPERLCFESAQLAHLHDLTFETRNTMLGHPQPFYDSRLGDGFRLWTAWVTSLCQAWSMQWSLSHRAIELNIN